MIAETLWIYGLTMGSASAGTLAFYPAMTHLWDRLSGRVERFQQAKIERATRVLDDMFVEVKPRWLKLAYGVGPLGVGLALYLLTNNLLIVVAGAVAGVVFPDLWVRRTTALRKRKFQGQLVDALFILSSSLRAGLSLTQAFEVLESEMPPPASQEFGLMIRAHRVGRTFEEALQGLTQRMACEEMNLITTAILVSRSTGGDVTKIITQLVGTIREKRKLHDKVKTLTLQGRLQAYIMSTLPLIFAVFVRTFNPRYFDILLSDPTGKMLLGVAMGLWVLGMVLLMKLSRVNV